MKQFSRVAALGLVAVAMSVGHFYKTGTNVATSMNTSSLVASDRVAEASAEVTAESIRPNPKEIVVVLNGTQWDVQLVPMNNDETKQIQYDHLTFSKNQLISDDLTAQGYNPAHYTMTVNSGGTIVWETMHRGSEGQIVSWKGEWTGDAMRGVISKRLSDGQYQNFNFVGKLQGGGNSST